MTRSSTILATLLALTVAMPARAQAASRPVQPPAVGRPTDPAVASIAADVRAGLVEMARADRDLLPSDGESTLPPAEDEALDRRARARVRVATGLESLLAAGAPGRAAIRTLATDWPDAESCAVATLVAPVASAMSNSEAHQRFMAALPWCRP